MIALLLVWTGVVSAATISARVDRDVVTQDESFLLSFDIDGEVDGEPDFSPLDRDFEILNQSRSQNISISNGQTIRQNSWHLSVLARAPGPREIPAIRFGNDFSNPITVMVNKASTTPGDGERQIYLEAAVDVERPYVQQQILLTVRLLRAVETNGATLSDPEVEGVEVLVERFGDDKAYQSLRGGRRYHVVERRYHIFPQQSGSMTIKPLKFKGEIRQRRGGSRFDLFDRGGSRFVRTRSQAITLTVSEAPVSGTWLPARHLRLREDWPQQDEFKVGEPVTRRIVIEADGLTAAQLPELPQPLPDGFKAYREQPRLENSAGSRGIVGRRTEDIALVPTRAGRFELPPLELGWWSTVDRSDKLASLPPRTITVTAADTPAVTIPAAAAGEAQQGVIVTEAPASVAWRWVALALALGWGSTLLWVWHRRGPAAGRSATPPATVAPRHDDALRALRAACAASEPEAARDALQDWAVVRWPRNRPGNLGQIAERCGGELADEIRRLERTLYAKAAPSWRDPRLYELVRAAGDPEATTNTGDPTPGLEPLYRTH